MEIYPSTCMCIYKLIYKHICMPPFTPKCPCSIASHHYQFFLSPEESRVSGSQKRQKSRDGGTNPGSLSHGSSSPWIDILSQRLIG